MLHKTNSEYARLAYRRTILVEVIRQLQRTYLPNDATPTPQRKLLCDAVLGGDAEVPPEAFQEFLAELHHKAEDISVEMTDFNFTRVTKRDDSKPSTEKNIEKPEKKGARKPARTSQRG